MVKRKFLLDLDLLHISEHKPDLKLSRKLLLSGTGISLLLGIVISLVIIRNLDSPNEKKLRNQILNYQVRYSVMSSKINELMRKVDHLETKDDDVYRVIYEMSPVSEDLRAAGTGGAEIYKPLLESENTILVARSLENVDKIMRKMNVQSKSFDDILQAAVAKEKLMSSMPTIMPVTKERIRVTSPFGWRRSPFNRNNFVFHAGVDFAGKVGTPIYATGDGVVGNNNTGMTGYGVVLVIEHGYGYETLYGHLSKALVKPGDKVKRGQVIGYLGNTGSSTGPHLHYEVHKNKEKINPMNYIANSLTKQEYQEILKQAEELD